LKRPPIPGSARRLARRYRRARILWPDRIRRAAAELRPEAAPPAPEPTAPPEPEAAPRETLLRALQRGRTLDDALMRQLRSLLAAGDTDGAWALAESLRAQDETRMLGHVAAGITAYRRGFAELAHEQLRAAPRELWTVHAAPAYARGGLAAAPEETLGELRALVADEPPGVPVRTWYDIAVAAFGYGDEALARSAFEAFERGLRADPGSWREGARHADWLRPWIAADGSSPTAPPPERGRRSFAVMDYGHPGANRASANIGDHIQTVAALGHLVRHRGVRLHGAPELVALLDELGERVRPERRRDDVDADLEVLTVHRDASMYEAIPADTWTLCFGWYMHAIFGLRHGFPLHDNLRPIFVSFHCNKRSLLTPAAVEYLRRYGPVGCRDWTTVDLLLSLDVPAFFSGCVTTTIDTVFPEPAAPPADAPVAYVDVPAAEGGVHYRHSSIQVRRRSFVANVRVALEALDTYRTRHRKVVTSRLHCYLPVRALGVDVEFRPVNPSDIRFDGLAGIDDRAWTRIREGLTEKLEAVMGAILGGRPEADVYALWRELTAADVAAARERNAQPVRLPAPAADLDAQVARIAGETATREPAAAAPGEPVHVAAIVGKGGVRNLSVLVASLLEHTRRPLHVWMLVLPGTGARLLDELSERFPQVAFSRVPLHGLGAGLWTPAGEQARPRTIARLVLAELLPGVARVVLLPLPSVASADVAELAGLDLGGHAVAAARRPGTAISGFGVIHAAALRLGRRAEAASDLRRTAHARHAFDFDAFMDDVLVLDLERLRRDRFADEALRLVQAYGLTDLEVLHFVMGPDRATIPARWAVVPTWTPERGPGLMYWVDRVKPAGALLTAERDGWRRRAQSLRRGDGTPA
jgi:hypothetical protein